MPISTSSPLREILWNKLYAPQYQTVDQNNISVAADRNRRVGTADAMMNEQRLMTMEKLKADPNNPELQTQVQAMNEQGNLSYEDQMKQGLVQNSTYQTNLDAAKGMLNVNNLTKQEELSYVEDRRDRETFDNLAAKTRSTPTVNAGQPNGKVPEATPAATPDPNAQTNTTNSSTQTNATGKKKKGGKK